MNRFRMRLCDKEDDGSRRKRTKTRSEDKRLNETEILNRRELYSMKQSSAGNNESIPKVSTKTKKQKTSIIRQTNKRKNVSLRNQTTNQIETSNQRKETTPTTMNRSAASDYIHPGWSLVKWSGNSRYQNDRYLITNFPMFVCRVHSFKVLVFSCFPISTNRAIMSSNNASSDPRRPDKIVR